jgi:hypothetical protein
MMYSLDKSRFNKTVDTLDGSLKLWILINKLPTLDLWYGIRWSRQKVENLLDDMRVERLWKYYSWTFFTVSSEDTDPNVKNLGEMTAKLYESIKLRLDQLADKGIENIDDMTKIRKSLIISSTFWPEYQMWTYVLGYLTISRLRKFMLMQKKWPIRSVAVLNWTEAEQNEREELEKIAISQADRFPRPPIYFDRSDMLMARESREEQDRRSAMQNLNSVESF